MSLPSDFDPVAFLYLNPEVSSALGGNAVLTVEEAEQRYADEFSALPYKRHADAGELIGDVRAGIFLATHRDLADVSALNRVIVAAESNVTGAADFSDSDAFDGEGEYVANFYAQASLLAASDEDAGGAINVFRLEDGADIGPSNMQAGDSVKLLRRDGEGLVVLGEVSEILDARRFRLQERFDRDVSRLLPSVPPDTPYTLYGIRVRDAERLADINFLRLREAGHADVGLSLEGLQAFNPELYEVLYPEARALREDATASADRYVTAGPQELLSREELFGEVADAVGPDPVNRKRITQVTDLTSAGRRIQLNGFTLCNVSYDSQSAFRDAADDAIIPERTIKQYVDRPYTKAAAFRGELLAGLYAGDNNAITGFGNSNLAPGEEANLRVDGSSFQLRSDLSCLADVTCVRGIGEALLANDRVGIGSANVGQVLEEASNASLLSLNVPDTLGLDGAWLVRGEEYATGTSDQQRALALRHVSDAPSAPLLRLLAGEEPGRERGAVLNGDLFLLEGNLRQLSDRRCKRDVRRIAGAMRRVRCLRGSTFEYVSDEEKECKNAARRSHRSLRRAGLMAQDVARVLPEAVRVEHDSGRMTLDYGSVVPLLVEAIKDLDARVSRIRRMRRYNKIA